MEKLVLHTNAPVVHWKDNKIWVSIVEPKRVTHRVNYIYFPVFFLQENVDYGIFVPKYEMSSVIPEDMCTKPCLYPIISRSTQFITGFRLYPTSDIEHY